MYRNCFNGILLAVTRFSGSLIFRYQERKNGMRLVIQCVDHAEVETENEIVGRIGKGFLVFAGICEKDTRETADKMIEKMLKLRIFEDENGKTNLNLSAVGGEILLVSQFTLYASCKKGNRPGFSEAGSPEHAKKLYEYIIARCRETVPVVQTGEFGAEMKVSLVNDGPFTIMLDESILPAGKRKES